MNYTAIMEHNYTRRKANACAALGAPSKLCESAKLGGWDANQEIARRIQYHQVTLHQRQSASGLSAITPQQKELFETVALPEPSARRL